MSLLSGVFQDWHANRGNLKARLILALFRLASLSRQPLDEKPKLRALPVGFVYRVLVEWFMNVELPWKTIVGPRLTLYHGQGLVVNDATVIGADVVLRHAVTIGHSRPGGPCPIIRDRVTVGAGAAIIGGVTIGEGATIGAHALVIKDIGAGAVALGVQAVIREAH